MVNIYDDFERLVLGKSNETSDTSYMEYDVLIVDDVKSSERYMQAAQAVKRVKMKNVTDKRKSHDSDVRRLYIEDTSASRALGSGACNAYLSIQWLVGPIVDLDP